MYNIASEQMQLQSIAAADIGLGLPFELMSGIGLTKNHKDDSAWPIVYSILRKLIGFDTSQAMQGILNYAECTREC